MNRTRITLLLLIVGTVTLGVGYVAGISTAPEMRKLDFKVDVLTVKVPDLPLCDATHTTNCAAGKVDWNTLQVHTAPGVTRTVVGSMFLPNAKE